MEMDMKTPQNDNGFGFATRAIHAGDNKPDIYGSLIPPVYMTSTFVFDNVEQGAARFAGEEGGHFYTRVSNPTLSILEQRLANLENTEAALACASGMGAITSTFWTLLKSGDEIIVDKTLYGCTYAFITGGLQKFGVKARFVDMTNPDHVRAALTSQTKLIYFETPANPNMRLIDIKVIAKIAKAHDVLCIVDNTYSTPYVTRPIELGADIVVHSATKYLGGHGDLIAGLVAGPADLISDIRVEGLKDMTGAVMAPLTAHQIMRGLKTLELRIDRHSSTALTIARALEQHPAIESVAYPGLENFEQHDLAKQQMSRFGGMIAFELAGGIEAGRTMMNALTLVKRAVSLGDPDTLIQHPASMTHAAYSPEERAAHGISDGLVRLSCGLETPDDILADLMQALEKATSKQATPKLSDPQLWESAS
jgi:methionine-gamma-lyase